MEIEREIEEMINELYPLEDLDAELLDNTDEDDH